MLRSRTDREADPHRKQGVCSGKGQLFDFGEQLLFVCRNVEVCVSKFLFYLCSFSLSKKKMGRGGGDERK